MEASTINDQNKVMFDILRKVSEKEGCDELDLPPLYETIDPSVLNTLATAAKIQFNYIGYEITVENGIVTVDQ